MKAICLKAGNVYGRRCKPGDIVEIRTSADFRVLRTLGIVEPNPEPAPKIPTRRTPRRNSRNYKRRDLTAQPAAAAKTDEAQRLSDTSATRLPTTYKTDPEQ